MVFTQVDRLSPVVLQGLILGPKEFNIFTDDLDDNI